MDLFSESALIAISAPVYLVVIVAEMVFSRIHKRGYYSGTGILQNLYLMIANMGLDIMVRGFCLLILTWAFNSALISWTDSWIYWVCLVIGLDFLYYLLHYTDLHCRLFWAVHVTHHSSQEFNLTVGFRSSVLQPLYRFIFFLPLAFAGFNPLDILLVYSACQIYGILLHTQLVGKLGFLEKILVTPSHHRVHHASNPIYLDKNMGMLLIIWDRLLGTFQEELEDVPAVYGLTTNRRFTGPVDLVFHEWKQMWLDFRLPIPIPQKIKYLLHRPGWSHDGSRKTSVELRREFLSGKQTG
jgi:sterol desaturase/sphingolipid hydroxylase (fatty acid hydroxylase superfamily)